MIGPWSVMKYSGSSRASAVLLLMQRKIGLALSMFENQISCG
jgi:hypothetical protein